MQRGPGSLSLSQSGHERRRILECESEQPRLGILSLYHANGEVRALHMHLRDLLIGKCLHRDLRHASMYVGCELKQTGDAVAVPGDGICVLERLYDGVSEDAVPCV